MAGVKNAPADSVRGNDEHIGAIIANTDRHFGTKRFASAKEAARAFKCSVGSIFYAIRAGNPLHDDELVPWYLDAVEED